MHRRDVHRHVSVVGPRRGFGARHVQYLKPPRDYQAGLLRAIDENVRCKHAPHRVIPAKQCLETLDAAGVRTNLRLVVQLELPRLDRKPKFLQGRCSLPGPRPQHR